MEEINDIEAQIEKTMAAKLKAKESPTVAKEARLAEQAKQEWKPFDTVGTDDEGDK